MKKIILFIMTLLMLAACSGASTANITGDWKLVSYGSVDSPTPAIPDVDTLITFDPEGQMNGNVGCNGFGGNYKISSGKITFDSIMSTLMFCEGTSDQEQAVLGVFSDKVGLQFQLNDNTLTITSADGLSVVNLERK